MRCAKLKRIIVSVPAEERSEQVRQEIEQHLRECQACARYVRQMTAITDSLRSLDTRRAPENFALMVTSRIKARRRKARAGWLQRVLGVQRPPAPLVSPQLAWGAASAVALVLVVGLFVSLPHQGSSVAPTNGVLIVDNGKTLEVALPVMDEMELRHRRYSRSLAVTDDPGMNLVSYSPGEGQ